MPALSENQRRLARIALAMERGAPPTYYTETNLFGTEGSYRISRTGEILKTIEAISEDGMLTFTIPKGTIALDKDGNRLGSLEAAVDESPPARPEDAYIIGLAYDFGPDGATFSRISGKLTPSTAVTTSPNSMPASSAGES